MAKSTLKIILKTKNEKHLFKNWIEYHSKVVGWDNLIIVDNYSDCDYTKKLYEHYSDKYDVPIIKIGGNINSASVYRDSIYAKVIDNSKFFILLDTDEYLVFYDWINNNFTINNILPYLSSLRLDKTKSIGCTWLYNCYDTKLPYNYWQYYLLSQVIFHTTCC